MTMESMSRFPLEIQQQIIANFILISLAESPTREPDLHDEERNRMHT